MFKHLFISILILLSISCSKKSENNTIETTKKSTVIKETIIPDSTVLEWFKVNKEISTLVENYKYITLKDSSNRDSIYNDIDLKRTELLKSTSFGTMDSFIVIRKQLTNSVKYDSLFLVNGMRIVK